MDTGNPSRPNVLEIPGTTNLGTTFTLSAMVKMTNKGRTRIFSSYRGEDDPGSYEVSFDVDPSGSDFPGLRATIHSTQVRSGPVTIVRDTYHHFAMTYADGDVRLYFDGQVVGRGSVQGGPVFSYYDVRLGYDWGGTGAQQQFAGYMDDILVLPQALKQTDIEVLCRQGAEPLSGVVNFLPPIRTQAIHSELTIRTRLVRLFCPRRRRSWTVTRLRRRASRRAFLTDSRSLRLCRTPARLPRRVLCF